MKNVLITGGSEGIGLETAKKFAQLGYNVIITGRNEEKLISAKACINSKNVEYMTWDISDLAIMEEKYDECCHIFGNIDILINNAGVLTQFDKGKDNGFLGVTLEAWDYTMNTNLKSTYFMCQYAIKNMIKNNIHGHIVNLCSVTGFSLNAATPYHISKWGVRAFTHGISRIAAKYGITVNGVAPGSTATKLSLDYPDMPIEDSSIPRGRMATPEEIADTVVFLASEKARNIVGECIISSGGQVL